MQLPWRPILRTRPSASSILRTDNLQRRPAPAGLLSHHGLRGSSSSSSCSSVRRRRTDRDLLTLAIETSCDDTCVAVLSRDAASRAGGATLRFDGKVTSDNRAFGGVHPVAAFRGHVASLAGLVDEALAHLPAVGEGGRRRGGRSAAGPHTGGEGAGARAARSGAEEEDLDASIVVRGVRRRRPDFVSVTRGPGMVSNLSVGLSTAKGLATAWQVPLVAVNHMQAHALTPRLVDALERSTAKGTAPDADGPGPGPEPPERLPPQPAFPFLSLLVSGGHTLLVESRSATDHRILAAAADVAVGDAIDKVARDVLPPETVAGSPDVMFGRQLEAFAFPREPTSASPPPASRTDADDDEDGYDYGYSPPARRADELEMYRSPSGWTLTPPLRNSRAMEYNFTGFPSAVHRIVAAASMSVDERRLLARQSLRLLFEHLGSRVLLALADDRELAAKIDTLVVSGGVASNRFLRHVLRRMLDARGFGKVRIVAPPVRLCTDNAAMIAWTGMEMFVAGWESELGVEAVRKWAVDPRSEDGGILGIGGWVKRQDG